MWLSYEISRSVVELQNIMQRGSVIKYHAVCLSYRIIRSVVEL